MQHPEHTAGFERRLERCQLGESGHVGDAEDDGVMLSARGAADPQFAHALLQVRQQMAIFEPDDRRTPTRKNAEPFELRRKPSRRRYCRRILDCRASRAVRRHRHAA